MDIGVSSCPLVSVIIPVYNVEKYINECVDSVLSQTYSEIEIILVNDGSTDSSGVRCDHYARIGRKVNVIHQENAGLSAARNTGLCHSTGKYIYFLDSDDYIIPDAIRSLVTEAEHFAADVVFFDAICIDENGTPDYTNDRYFRKQNYTILKSGSDMLLSLQMCGDYYTCVPMLFIRRESLEDLTFINGIIHEDVLFTFLLFLKVKRTVHLPMVLYMRRIHGNSIMSTVVRPINIISICIILGEIGQIFENTSDRVTKKLSEEQLILLYDTLIERYLLLNAKEKKMVKNEYHHAIHQINRFKLRKGRLYRLTKGYVISFAGQKNVEQVLRKFHTEMNRRAYIRYLRSLKVNNEKNLFILGTPLHGNLGDHLITISEIDLFRKVLPEYKIFEIPMLVYNLCREELKKLIKPESLIVISGGGWLGSLWMQNEQSVRNMVKDFLKNRIIICPQTVYYSGENWTSVLSESREIFNKHSNLYLFLRERQSYDFVVENDLIGHPDRCFLTPDIALAYSRKVPSIEKKNKILFCFRKDREKQISDAQVQRIREYLWARGEQTFDTTTVYQYGISPQERDKEINLKFTEYKSAKLIITDRLHSMIFAALAGTPCIAFDNVTGKVFGVYQFISELDYISVVNSVEEAIKYCDHYLITTMSYVNNFNADIFDNLIKILKNLKK